MPYRVSIDNSPYQLEVEEIDGQTQKFLIRHAEKEIVVEAFASSLSHYTLLIDDCSYDVVISNGKGPPQISVNGHNFQMAYERSPEGKLRAKTAGRNFQGPADVKANMPGKIVKILVKAGDTVKKGQPLLVLEAMKMENELSSPHPGIVEEISVTSGQNVESGQKLVRVVATA